MRELTKIIQDHKTFSYYTTTTASMAEWSKALHLRCIVRSYAWVQTPLDAVFGKCQQTLKFSPSSFALFFDFDWWVVDISPWLFAIPAKSILCLSA